jgi:hypothetical protein
MLVVPPASMMPPVPVLPLVFVLFLVLVEVTIVMPIAPVVVGVTVIEEWPSVPPLLQAFPKAASPSAPAPAPTTAPSMGAP